jgi:predicted transcriptional regulator
MSKTLTFEISEDLYQSFDHIARRDGKTTEQVALEYLARRAAERRPKLSEEERRAAHEQFRRHIGATSLGHPTGADNESIDRDLAREYANTHEEIE